MGQINKNDQNSVINRHKTHRERAKVRKDLQNSVEAKLNCPFALCFDGRIDKTLKKINKCYKSSKNMVSEEHICMLREPGSSYVGHIGVAGIFDWGGPKPQITYNDVIRNFQKRNFLWSKNIVEWKI